VLCTAFEKQPFGEFHSRRHILHLATCCIAARTGGRSRSCCNRYWVYISISYTASRNILVFSLQAYCSYCLLACLTAAHFHAHACALPLPCLVSLPQNDLVARVPVALLGESSQDSTLQQHSGGFIFLKTKHPKRWNRRGNTPLLLQAEHGTSGFLSLTIGHSCCTNTSTLRTAAI
jgi:hypothetical protein